jgi:hypothetical protein
MRESRKLRLADGENEFELPGPVLNPFAREAPFGTRADCAIRQAVWSFRDSPLSSAKKAAVVRVFEVVRAPERLRY